MLSLRLALPVLSAILACGPRPAETCDPACPPEHCVFEEGWQCLPSDTSSAGPTSGPTGTVSTTDGATSTASTSTTGTATSATTDAQTTAPQTTGGTTASDTTSDGSTTADTTGEPGSSTGAPDPGQYAAQYFAGGLDRIFVRKADPIADLCTEVVFVWPGNPPPNLTLPAMWGLEWANVVDGAAGCLDLQQPLQNGVTATAVTGTATWAAMVCPKTLDLDVVATFPQGQPWVPAQVALQAAALPLQGC